jgi:hypothetical protein
MMQEFGAYLTTSKNGFAGLTFIPGVTAFHHLVNRSQALLLFLVVCLISNKNQLC